MIFEKVDLKAVIDSVTALVVALGVIYTAWQAHHVKKTVATIEKSVNGTATKAQDVINELRRQLAREIEISAEKSTTAAVLQASTGQQSLAPKSESIPIAEK